LLLPLGALAQPEYASRDVDHPRTDIHGSIAGSRPDIMAELVLGQACCASIELEYRPSFVKLCVGGQFIGFRLFVEGMAIQSLG
jgi:hypothetical protein